MQEKLLLEVYSENDEIQLNMEFRPESRPVTETRIMEQNASQLLQSLHSILHS